MPARYNYASDIDNHIQLKKNEYTYIPKYWGGPYHVGPLRFGGRGGGPGPGAPPDSYAYVAHIHIYRFIVRPLGLRPRLTCAQAN